MTCGAGGRMLSGGWNGPGYGPQARRKRTVLAVGGLVGKALDAMRAHPYVTAGGFLVLIWLGLWWAWKKSH